MPHQQKHILKNLLNKNVFKNTMQVLLKKNFSYFCDSVFYKVRLAVLALKSYF